MHRCMMALLSALLLGLASNALAQECSFDRIGHSGAFSAEMSRQTEDGLRGCIESGALTNPAPGEAGVLHALASVLYFYDLPPVVRLIDVAIDHGFDVNARDARGSTPLHRASSGAIVETLLGHGANPNIRNDRGQFPVHTLTTDPGVLGGGLEALLVSGVNVNVRDGAGNTPLHSMAYASRHLAGYQLLLAYGVDPGARNHENETAFDHLLADDTWPWEELAGSDALQRLTAASRRDVPADMPPAQASCDHVYVGQRFRGRERLAGLITLDVTYEVLGYSARSEQVTVRSLNGGNTYNIHCSEVVP
ncbi:hypothetical protein HKCCSP123_19110 [Rhodobacterales bacterium HKCCSP123]|nr:hypothetical protein [Rhodobacterales bacterium HKCCSP123]